MNISSRIPYYPVLALLVGIIVVGICLYHIIPIVASVIDRYNEKIQQQNEEAEKLLHGNNTMNPAPHFVATGSFLFLCFYLAILAKWV
ncbi:MAG: hypothetical protein PHW31_01985 [Candidatus Pacebacteria bacterium]|nr:hypothetical protein [Candidatus Paceibacterota bacterium]